MPWIFLLSSRSNTLTGVELGTRGTAAVGSREISESGGSSNNSSSDHPFFSLSSSASTDRSSYCCCWDTTKPTSDRNTTPITDTEAKSSIGPWKRQRGRSCERHFTGNHLLAFFLKRCWWRSRWWRPISGLLFVRFCSLVWDRLLMVCSFYFSHIVTAGFANFQSGASLESFGAKNSRGVSLPHTQTHTKTLKHSVNSFILRQRLTYERNENDC